MSSLSGAERRVDDLLAEMRADELIGGVEEAIESFRSGGTTYGQTLSVMSRLGDEALRLMLPHGREFFDERAR